MFKNKQFWVGFLLAVVVMVVLGEIQRSNNRAAALNDLNKTWPTLTKDSQKGAILVRTNTIIDQNKSWFNFSNSSADEGDDNGNGKHPKDYGMEFWGGMFSPSGGVTTGWAWFNPDTGTWVEGR